MMRTPKLHYTTSADTSTKGPPSLLSECLFTCHLASTPKLLENSLGNDLILLMEHRILGPFYM